ncbi:MAG: response regulator transcription factor [Lachnospiraceae bacterium]|nr:response regulator transcription factor [Lachnospiraceae bacterium]
MRILIIEDDTSLTELLIYGLEAEGFSVDSSRDGLQGLTLALQNLHDMILLDRMLPHLSGEEILKRLRQNAVHTPVIFITAIGESSEKINGLDLGADDYLVKPFDIGELLARIRCVMRRTLNQSSPFFLQFGDIRFSEKESKLMHAEHTFLLSKKEGELLAYFLRNPNQVLSRMQIIGNVWGPEAEIEDGNLDNYIYLIRKKLNNINTAVRIVTVHRQGYCLMLK